MPEGETPRRRVVAEPARGPEKPKKPRKKRAEPVYVPVAYPASLGAASLAWAAAGWLVAAHAPRLAFVPGVAALHVLLPAVTAGLLAVNLAFAVRNLVRGAHVLRIGLITGVEMALFTTLFFQLYAHLGAELYDAPGATGPWHWFQFSAAHAFRAGDVFDAAEAYGWGIQTVKHTSPLVGLVVVAYHVVVDVFFLGLVWAGVGRFREAVLADDEFRGMLVRLGIAAFAVWFVAWVVVAFIVRPWRWADVPLWYLENFVRVVDFADVMESFGVRFHTLPRDEIVGTLTLFCRFWIAAGVAALLTRKRKPPPRRVLTPPGAAAGPYWRNRVAALAGMAVALLAVGVLGHVTAGEPAAGLAAAAAEDPDARSVAALRALRRMGPAAAPAAPALLAGRKDVSPAVRDEITRTLGYLGAGSAAALRDIALSDPPESAAVAVDALAAVGGPAAPDIVAVWEAAPAEATRETADAALRRVGGEAVESLMAGFTPDTAYGHTVWLDRLDPNWRLRSTDNAVARACQGLPDLIRRANGSDPADKAAAMDGMTACGSAARLYLDTAIDRLGDRDGNVQAAAVRLVVAAGPAATPRLLAVVGRPGFVPPGVFTVLNNPGMWTPAVLDDPAARPALLALVSRPDGGFAVALPHLARLGPAAAPAVPFLVPHLADPDPATRATVRTTLAALDPNWKTGPSFAANAGRLVHPAALLPKSEADELFAAFPVLTVDQAGDVLKGTNEKVRDLGKQITASDLRRNKDGLQLYAAGLDPAFAPLERLGPKGKAAVPALAKWLGDTKKELNDPRPRVVGERLVRVLTALDADSKDAFAATARAMGTGPDGVAFMRAQGKKAVPYLRELFVGSRGSQGLFALQAAAAIGPDAAELVPDVTAALRSMNVMVRPGVGDEVWLLGEAARALTAIDPDWWGRPEAAAALGELMKPNGLGSREVDAARRRLLNLIAGGGPAAAAAAARIAAGLVAQGIVDEPARAVLDGLDPTWREADGVKAAAPAMVRRMAGEGGFAAERAVSDLGPAGIDGLTVVLNELTKDALADGPGGSKGGFLRNKSVAVLGRFGPAAKSAAPALLILAGKADLSVEGVPAVLDALDAVSPGWAADPAHKAAARAAGESLMKRAAKGPVLVGAAARCGVEVGDELGRRLATTRYVPEVEALLKTVGDAGPAAKGAAPALVKMAGDPDARPRDGALEALGKVAAGDAALVPAVAPLLLDPLPKVRAAAASALDRFDPKWRTKPAAKQVVATARTQLAGPDAGKRAAAADALGFLADPALVGTLAPAVLDTEPAVREAAGKALDRFDAEWRAKPAAKQTAAAAVKQLGSTDARKRFDAVGALDILRPAEAVAALTQLVGREQDANTKQYAEQVLGRLRKTP